MKRTEQINFVVIRQKGFTLIEVMVTVAIVAILAAIGIPALGDFTAQNQLRAETNRLVGMINFARSEAITRNVAVNLYTPTGQDWMQAIDIYTDEADSDGNSNFSSSDGDEMIRQYDAGPDTIVADGNGAAGSYIAFDNRGRLAESGIAVVAVCDQNYKFGRLISINLVGRVSVSEIASPSSVNCTR